ncbi:MAG: endonuclease, partial [Flavobacteriales bacterium]|nr:endonuclease [Flavobacteriales bacterium]
LVPQSFYGSVSPMRSDIWSLRPAHGSANSARSNNPFGEVDDAAAQWYGVDGQGNYISTGNQPANADDFSERSGGFWEPRESQKGDVARAVFYFYTVYPTQAGSLSGIGDPDMLYAWHLNDPVDAFEQQRNDRIETAQGNRNPYVDYPNIVFRAWFETTVVPGCTNSNACNYASTATTDDGSCILLGAPCDDGDALTLGDVYTDCAAANYGCQGQGPQTLWEETFDDFTSLSYGYNGNTNTAANEPEWSITYGGATDHFYTLNFNGDTMFAGKDLDFDCTWTSRVIDASGFTDLQASVNLRERGRWEGTDYVRFEALLDGETVVLTSISDDFGTTTINPVSISDASEVQLRIVSRTNANGEFIYFDDVRLIGVPNCVDADSDGLCDDLDNCTDVTACNYTDPSAVTCLELDDCGTCGGPGAVLECGCNDIPEGDCDCEGNQADAIGVCGGDCPADSDNDGICDTDDECLGQLDACGVCNGPGAVFDCGCSDIPAGDCDCDGNQLDALDICGGNCASDDDSDGICDDVDSCIGGLDACGVCNGPGAVYECGCSDVPADDCDCNGNQLDALGVCGGDCPADSDLDGICDTDEIAGCTDPNASNYNDTATDADGSCTYVQGSFIELTADLISENGAGAGLNTWRVYAKFSNPGVDLLSVYGTSASPIDLSTSTTWYQDPLGSSVGDGINTALLTESPTLQFDSWITIGAQTSEDGNITTVGLDLTSFEQGDDLTSDEVAGGSWLAIPGEVNGASPDADGRVLIAQLTTDGTVVLDCNLQYREPNGATPVATELSLVFQNGCPEDINGSGMVDIEDILAVLTQFGCTGNCTGDLDGDGDVDVADGLQVLGAFTNLCN